VRAALIHELGSPPEVGEAHESAEATIDVSAAALNPLDIAVGSGRFYGGHPPLPYIPGCEAVGLERETGRRVYASGGGLGTARDGTLAARVAAPADLLIPLPDGIEDDQALACGIAGLAGWLPVTWRAPVSTDDRVLVLGATGTVGLAAVQGARLHGAARVVAAGRNPDGLERAARLGADATVRIDEEKDLATAFREAAGGDGPTVVVDPLWGEPVRAALEAAASGARIVHLGQSAGPEATLPSSLVRGKQLAILGYSNFAVPEEVRRAGYLDLARRVAAGEVRFDTTVYPLHEIAEAWARQAGGPGTKVVVAVSV